MRARVLLQRAVGDRQHLPEHARLIEAVLTNDLEGATSGYSPSFEDTNSDAGVSRAHSLREVGYDSLQPEVVLRREHRHIRGR